MSVPQLEDLGDLSGRRVLVRADFNVPLGNSEITDDLRIRSAVPTLKWLVNAGAHVTVCSHLGRPQGEPNQQYSMTLVLFRLAELVPRSSCWRTCGLVPARLATTLPSYRTSSLNTTRMSMMLSAHRIVAMRPSSGLLNSCQALLGGYLAGRSRCWVRFERARNPPSWPLWAALRSATSGP